MSNKKNCSCKCKQHKSKQFKQKSICNCEPKFYFPLPNIPSQPVGGEKVKLNDWFVPGSVQTCCGTCSVIKPVYTNPCSSCQYNQGAFPINNTAYFTINQ